MQEIDTTNVLIDINTRIRVLEEKNNQLREKLQAPSGPVLV